MEIQQNNLFSHKKEIPHPAKCRTRNHVFPAKGWGFFYPQWKYSLTSF